MKNWIVVITFLFMFSLTGCEIENSNNDDTDTVIVYFNVYGGSVVDSITLEKGDTISPPIEPL